MSEQVVYVYSNRLSGHKESIEGPAYGVLMCIVSSVRAVDEYPTVGMYLCS